LKIFVLSPKRQKQISAAKKKKKKKKKPRAETFFPLKTKAVCPDVLGKNSPTLSKIAQFCQKITHFSINRLILSKKIAQFRKK
jgi:hypothetical protein